MFRLLLFVQVYHGLRYRFEVVLSELSTAESDVLCATLLALVNCLVFGCEDLHQRHRIRNEFLGMLLQYYFLDIIQGHYLFDSYWLPLPGSSFIVLTQPTELTAHTHAAE
jgi:hypothetical protein